MNMICKHKVWIAALFGLLVVGLMIVAMRPKGVSGPASAAPSLVEVAPVEQKDVQIYVEHIGTLDGFVNADVRAQVTGYLLRQDYQEGGIVKKGQLLFEIDPRPFQAALDQAQGQLAQAKATLGNAGAVQRRTQLDVDRYTPLAKEQAASQQWIVYREFIDHETGKTNDREQFQLMFKDASQRKFDVLLFWALDRLSREGVLETLQHLNRLTAYRVGYRSFTEQYFDSCGIFRDAVIAIIATVAKQERVRISERVKAGLETARAKGKRLGRPRVILDARRIAALRAQGLSWAKIAVELGVGEGTVYRIAHASAKNPTCAAL